MHARTRFLAPVFLPLALGACVAPYQAYQPPSGGPTAQLSASATGIGRQPGRNVVFIRPADRCVDRTLVRDEFPVRIPAGKPLVIERRSSADTIGCETLALRFVPREGETYETRLHIGLRECRALLLRVAENGRTQPVEGVERVNAECD